MRPFGIIAGVVQEDSKIVQPKAEGKKTFLEFKVITPSRFADSEFPDRITCSLYGREIDAAAKEIIQGKIIVCTGEIMSAAFKKDDGKVFAYSKMFVKDWYMLDPETLLGTSRGNRTEFRPPKGPQLPPEPDYEAPPSRPFNKPKPKGPKPGDDPFESVPF